VSYKLFRGYHQLEHKNVNEYALVWGLTTEKKSMELGIPCQFASIKGESGSIEVSEDFLTEG